MNYDSNDDEEPKLTKEYKHLLSYIRPLIDQLDKTRDAQLCLLWLSKLEQCGRWEKNYRNQILSELCKQVKAHSLKSPFNNPPPNGSLRNIIFGDRRVQEDHISDYSGDVSTEPELTSSSPKSSKSVKALPKRLTAPSSFMTNYLCPSGKNKVSQHGPKSCKEVADHSECFAIQKAYHERAQSDQLVIERYQDVIKSLVSQQLKADASPTKLKKLQSTYESKMAELTSSLKKVEEENETLRNELNRVPQNLQKLEELKNENETLKQQLADLESAKISMETKYKQNENENLKALTDLIGKLNESDKKLKETEKHCKTLEREFEENFHNQETEHLAQLNEKEKKFVAELTELEGIVEKKNVEIVSLKEKMASQCAHFEEEVARLKQELVENPAFDKNKKKIKILKSKARKLEKIREHMAVLFHSQLEQVIAKKDFYIATLEMQLKMNNCEIGSNNLSSDVHSALNQKVSTLEAQYRKLLEDSEQQSIRRRQLDLQKIHTLEKQLLLCGGVIEDTDAALNSLKTKSLSSVIAMDEDSNVDRHLQC